MKELTRGKISNSLRSLRDLSQRHLALFSSPLRAILPHFCLSPSPVTANFPTSLRLDGAACFLAIYVHVNILQNERTASRCASWTILHPTFATRDAKLWKKYIIHPQIRWDLAEGENLRVHVKKTDIRLSQQSHPCAQVLMRLRINHRSCTSRCH